MVSFNGQRVFLPDPLCLSDISPSMGRYLGDGCRCLLIISLLPPYYLPPSPPPSLRRGVGERLSIIHSTFSFYQFHIILCLFFICICQNRHRSLLVSHDELLLFRSFRAFRVFRSFRNKKRPVACLGNRCATSLQR